MTEIHPELARRALTLGRISAVAGALDLDVGELITLVGLFESRLSKFTRVTIDGRFAELSIMSLAPEDNSAMASELRRRESPLASRLSAEPVAKSTRYLELTSDGRDVRFSVWELGKQRDGSVGDIHRADTSETCRVVGGPGNPDGREVFAALTDKLDIAEHERRLLADVHPLLSRNRPTMYSLAQGSSPALTVFYRDIATSDVIRVLVGLRLGDDVGERLGRFAGATEASQLDVLEISFRPSKPPTVRLSVDLVAFERGAR